MLCWGPDGTRWGVRRILAHIRNLPAEAAAARKWLAPYANWSQSVELTASLLDAVKLQTYYLLRLNGQDTTVPDKFPRPGPQPEPESVPLSALGQFLEE